MILEHLFEQEYPNNNLPNWPCPTCGKGILLQDAAKYREADTARSRSWANSEDWEADWREGRFSATLNCNNSDCLESVWVIGNVNYSLEDYSDGANHGQVLVVKLEPTFFNPTLILYGPPKGTPEAVVQKLEEAQKLMWTDASSATNHVRTSLELFLDSEGIPRQTATGGFLSLADRITQYAASDPALKSFLDAIRFLGNHGTHDAVSRESFVQSLDLMDHLLNLKVKGAILGGIASGINARRGP